MLIEYIYLIVIIVIIITIIYIIYLSYEYRENIKQDIEQFINPQIDILPSTNENYNKQINIFLDEYNNFKNNVYNRQIINDTNEYQNLVKNLSNNLNNTNQLIKDKQILKSIPESFPINQLIKTIKSNYNSQYLSLFANDINKYGILVNDQCLTVNGLCKDEYCLQNCQNNLYTSDSQKFYTNRILSNNDVHRIMNIPLDKVNSKNIYPFNIFRSTINDKCLSISNNGITLENCNLNNINQQWAISPNENICINN